MQNIIMFTFYLSNDINIIYNYRVIVMIIIMKVPHEHAKHAKEE